MYDRLAIANRIYIARKNNYLKQREVCATLGINQSSYSALELGKRDLNVAELFILSKMFNVSISWLLGSDSVPQLTDSECLELENYKKYLISKRK